MNNHLLYFVLGLGFSLAGCGDKENNDENDEIRAEPEGANPGECTDGADNDFDGDYDCNDEDCAGSPDCLESDCDDGADNDQDGDFDCDDSDCEDAPECATEDDCTDGADNDADGLFDCDDPDCAEDTACVDDFEGDEAGECTDGIDNDSDGFVDCDDPDCDGSPDCEEEQIGVQSNPGLSCKDILDLGGSTGDGIYWIDPEDSGPFEVYCDMTTDGGGWTEFFSGTNGTSNVFATFVGPGEDCPSPGDVCMRHVPDTVSISTKLAIVCGTSIAQIDFNPNLLNYFQSGQIVDWVTTSNAQMLVGTLGDNTSLEYLGGTERGWIFSGGHGNPYTAFASVYDNQTGSTDWEQCNGVQDGSSDVKLLYR